MPYSTLSDRYYRAIGEAPRETDNGTHSNVNETIDGSVFDRWRRVTEYRPPNLIDWAARNEVDIAKLNNSVLAHTPSVAVPD